MSRNKCLFLFAGYDKDGIIDDALIYYLRALSNHGDIILCLDSNCSKKEIAKTNKYTIKTIASKHGEYDFGSYKRAYIYAYDKNILKNYDFVYMVNDSVFGPMFDIKQTLQSMQSATTDAVGIVVATHKTHSYMESWFVQLNKKIFISKWFYDFITSVQHEEYKYIITVKYEHGLTNIIKNNDCSYSGIYTCRGRFTYNNPKKLFKYGCPFIKKSCFTRHNGGLGKQIQYVLKHSNKNAVKSITKTANRVYGEKYMKWFLTNNPLKIISRNLKYSLYKIKNGGI